MIEKKEFNKRITRTFSPLMRNEGYKGSSGRYRKVIDNKIIFCVNLQGNKYGGSFCIEIGVHFIDTPFNINQRLELSKASSYDCDFRKRVAPEHYSDYWWECGENTQEADSNLENAFKTLKHVSEKYCSLFIDYPNPFVNWTLDNIQNAIEREIYGDITEIRLALSIAQVQIENDVLDNIKQLKEFIVLNTKEVSLVRHAIMELTRNYKV